MAIELRRGTRLRVNDRHGNATCTIIRHIRGWKYSTLFDDYIEREVVLSAFDFSVLRDQPGIFSIEHGFDAIQPRQEKQLRCLQDNESLFDVEA